MGGFFLSPSNQSTDLGAVGHIVTHTPQATHFSATMTGRGTKRLLKKRMTPLSL